MSLRTPALALAALAVPLAAGCPAPRNAPATWTAAKAFDVTTSDPRALKIADEVLAAVGGEAAWKAAHELKWAQVIMLDGQPSSNAQHAWDRWNGRHHLRFTQQGEGFNVMYDLFDMTGKGWVVNGGRNRDATRQQMRDMMKRAKEHLGADAYFLCLPFKLKDPGVHLRWMEERSDPGDESRKLDVIRVSFDPGVGRDIYYLVVDRATHMPDSIEWVKEGNQDNQRVGYKLLDWTDVGGLKFATRRQNVGYAGEVVNVSDIAVSASPQEDEYVPKVEFPG